MILIVDHLRNLEQKYLPISIFQRYHCLRYVKSDVMLNIGHHLETF